VSFGQATPPAHRDVSGAGLMSAGASRQLKRAAPGFGAR